MLSGLSGKQFLGWLLFGPFDRLLLPEEHNDEETLMFKVVEIKNTCDACPAQWEGIDAEGRPVYVRYRWGYLAISLGEKFGDIVSAINGEEIFGTQLGHGLHGEMSYDQLRAATKGIIEFPPQEVT